MAIAFQISEDEEKEWSEILPKKVVMTLAVSETDNELVAEEESFVSRLLVGVYLGLSNSGRSSLGRVRRRRPSCGNDSSHSSHNEAVQLPDLIPNHVNPAQSMSQNQNDVTHNEGLHLQKGLHPIPTLKWQPRALPVDDLLILVSSFCIKSNLTVVFSCPPIGSDSRFEKFQITSASHGLSLKIRIKLEISFNPLAPMALLGLLFSLPY